MVFPGEKLLAILAPDSAASFQFPISEIEQQALNLPCLSAEWRAQCKVTFHLVLTDGKP